MIAAQDDGEDAALRNEANSVADRPVGGFNEPVRAAGVAEVDHFELVEDLDAEVEVERAGSVGERSKSTRAKTRSRPIGGRVVPRRADDGDIGTPTVELLRLGEQRSLSEGRHTLERGPVQLRAHPAREVAPRVSHLVRIESRITSISDSFVRGLMIAKRAIGSPRCEDGVTKAVPSLRSCSDQTS